MSERLVDASSVRALREKTGAGVLDCKKALEQTRNNMTQALEWLREKGLSDAIKKVGRHAAQGLVASYIHGEGRIGVLLEVNCETDFVARTDQFKDFVKNLTLHIAASDPRYVSEEEIPTDQREKGEEWISEVCLLKQKFVKDSQKTIDEYLREVIARIGENIIIRRFVRWHLGEDTEEDQDRE